MLDLLHTKILVESNFKHKYTTDTKKKSQLCNNPRENTQTDLRGTLANCCSRCAVDSNIILFTKLQVGHF